MKIKPDDLVLEVGSGDKPYPRSDVLLDKLPEDSSEREAGRSLMIDRPLVIADVEALPFADKSFDYIIASHVLEHAYHPAKFLDEISRVGKRGYIETPLPLRELVFNWPFHRWYVTLEGDTLILIKKTEKSKQFFAGEENNRREFYCLEGKRLFNLPYEWKGKVKYKVLPEEPGWFLESLNKELIGLQSLISADKAAKNMVGVSKWLKNNLFKVKLEFEKKFEEKKRKKDINIFSLIVCPACQGQLLLRKDSLVCLACKRQFSFYREKIPILLL